jgi:hypothetical protein
MKKLVLVFIFLLLQFPSNGLADSIHTALVNLCDPTKIATISSERGANPRVRKIAYWLEMARKDGREPTTEMAEVMIAADSLAEVNFYGYKFLFLYDL